MRFAEELLLLLLDHATGFFIPIREWNMSCALAGSVLMDLALENRIDTDLTTLTLVDASPTGDELLDPALQEIAEDPGEHAPQYWVERIARRAEEINEAAIERLVKAGILDHDSSGFLSLSRRVALSGRYPLVDGRAGQEIKGRIMRTLLDDEIPDPRDIMVIGLTHTCGVLRRLMDPEVYEAAEKRIELLSGMDLIGRTIGEAVRSSYTPPKSLRTVRRRALPKVGMRDLLASRAFRSGNLPKFFAETTRKVGPVYRLPGGKQGVVVLASAEMNRWIGKNGRFYLRTRDYLEHFQTEWGTARSIASMDGADHFRMRRAMRAGNSRRVVEDRLDEVFALGRRTFADWGIGNTVRGEAACQRMIGEQIARLSVSIDPAADLLDELLTFEYRALLVHVMGFLPRFTLRTPAMKRAKARILDFYAQIHAAHTPAQRAGKRRDLVDDLMDLHQDDPQFLPETDLGFSFIAPLIAGHYMGSAIAFAVYELVKNPHVREQVAAEADALFANGDPVAANLTPAAIDATHRFAMEILRLHPVIPVHKRTAMNAMEIDGMEIPAGSTVLIAYTAPHFMEEHFEEPDKFDIDRYLPPRNEHKQQGAYAPFGTGTHICGGSRWTEMHMAVNLLLIARHLELELVPADYRLGRSALPKVSPNRKFRYRVTGHRHPL